MFITLYTPFSKYFDGCILKSVWLKAVMNYIPKGANKYPSVQLNYRGINLLYCVCKVFSEIIKYRIVNYCERYDMKRNII